MVQALSIVAAFAAAARAVAWIVLHVLPTGYSPRGDALSDCGIGRYRAWYLAQAQVGAVAGLALAIALAETTPSIPTLVVASIAWFVIVSIEPTRIAGQREVSVR